MTTVRQPVPPRLVEQVALEFLHEMGERTDVRGGIEQVREFLSQFMDSEEVDRIVSELKDQDVRPVWERFVEAPVPAAAPFLALEHPQTVAVILAGLFPILIGTGAGSEVMSRIAAPMVGGMVSALALTLILIPVLYCIFYRIPSPAKA